MALTARQAALKALAAVRGIAPALGFHTVTVSVVTRTWESGKIQTGTSTVSTLVLGSPDPRSGAILPPHVKGGSGDVEVVVGPITPFDPVVSPRGYAPAELNPAAAPGVEYYYLLVFPDGTSRQYVIVPRGIDTTNPLHYTIKLRSIDRKAPF